MNKDHYRKLALMQAISFCIMYSAMFLNVDRSDHIYFSLTRVYMSLLMVAPMTILMVLMMRVMYPSKKTNLLVITASAFVFILSLVLLRAQIPVSDVQYMKAMIPHHSSAILTSKEAGITDPEVKALAEKIIKSQEEEIAQMKSILERMNK